MTLTVFHLHKGPSGSVASLNDGALDPRARHRGGATSYSYPQPNWTLGVVPVGPTGPDPARAVLTFTSPPLAADVEIAGNGKVVLYASTTRDDMDFIVKVSEQFAQAADERAKGVQPRYMIATKGWLRVSHAEHDGMPRRGGEPLLQPRGTQAADPGKVYKVEVPLEPIAYRFRQGNRIRAGNRVRRLAGHRRAVLPHLPARQDRHRHDPPRRRTSLAPGAAGFARLITAWSSAATGRSAGRSSPGPW